MNELRRKVAALLEANLGREVLVDLLIDVVARGLRRPVASPRNEASRPEIEAVSPESGAECMCISESGSSLTLTSPEPSSEIEERTKTEYSPEFVQFWALYPRKTGKGDAWRAWKRQRPPLGKIRAALAWQCQLPDWLKEAGKYIPYPQKYINHHRWEDEPPRQLGPVLTDRERRSVSASQAWLERKQSEEP